MRRAGRTLRTLFFTSMLPAALVSCGDDLTLAPDPATRDRVPVLAASASTLKLEQAAFNATAVEFTWAPGSNHGTNAAIEYTLEFDRGGGSFAAPVAVPMGRGVYARAYTVAELNDFLTTRLKLVPDAAGSVQVRVKSATAGSSVAPDYSNVLTLAATPYRPVSSTLYLLGSAAPNGWDAGKAAALKRDSVVPFVFTYQGTLAAGEFKLITTLGQFLPSYNRGAGAGKLVYRTDDAQPDEKFTVTEPGAYKLTVNLVALTVAVEKQAGPAYSQLWIVGDATPKGWDIDNAAALRQDPNDPFLFEFNEVLKAGEFKIATARSWDAPFYRPTQNRPAGSETDVQLSAGDPDHKWYIAEPGAYKITLDTRSLRLSIRKFTPYPRLWIVGDATPSGWNIDNPTPMQADAANPYVFTYSGPLKAGEFKFPVATGDWGTDFFMPAVNAPELTDTYVRLVVGGQPDHKWKITEAGTYRITLDQLRETIRIEKQ